MAVDAYMVFYPYNGSALGDPIPSESMVDSGSQGRAAGCAASRSRSARSSRSKEFNFDIEQTLNLSSQSRGTGAGKVKFNGFTVTRKIDLSSPVFFQMACSGTPFALVVAGLPQGRRR